MQVRPGEVEVQIHRVLCGLSQCTLDLYRIPEGEELVKTQFDLVQLDALRRTRLHHDRRRRGGGRVFGLIDLRVVDRRGVAGIPCGDRDVEGHADRPAPVWMHGHVVFVGVDVVCAVGRKFGFSIPGVVDDDGVVGVGRSRDGQRRRLIRFDGLGGCTHCKAITDDGELVIRCIKCVVSVVRRELHRVSSFCRILVRDVERKGVVVGRRVAGELVERYVGACHVGDGAERKAARRPEFVLVPVADELAVVEVRRSQFELDVYVGGYGRRSSRIGRARIGIRPERGSRAHLNGPRGAGYGRGGVSPGAVVEFERPVEVLGRDVQTARHDGVVIQHLQSEGGSPVVAGQPEGRQKGRGGLENRKIEPLFSVKYRVSGIYTCVGTLGRGVSGGACGGYDRTA